MQFRLLLGLVSLAFGTVRKLLVWLLGRTYCCFLLCFKQDVEFESASAKKQTRGSSSTKRSRAAEVHNLSERVCTFHKLVD